MIVSLILSNDSIKMNPPYEITPEILRLITSISEKIGLNVSIVNKKNSSGTISFEYKDLEQLDKIIIAIKNNY